MVELRKYQQDVVKEGLQILKEHKILCLSMEVRTGKTLTSLSLAEEYGAKSVLFISKKKAITEGSIQGDYADLNPSYDIEFINYASVHKAIGSYDFVIIDESHSLGAFPLKSKRVDKVKKICRGLPIIFLSGTFTPESYSQIYHQLYVSSFSPFAKFQNFYKWSKVFVDVYQIRIGGRNANKYERARKDMIDGYTNKLFIKVSQEDAGFEQKINEQILYVDMDDTQKDLIKSIKDRGFCQVNGELCIPPNGASKLSKIAQICGGSLMLDDAEDGVVISRTKADYIYQHFKGQKIAILYVYRAEGELLREVFTNHTDDENVFRSDDSSTFIAQIRSAREGVDLSIADSLVMYSVDFSATSYFQGKARIQSHSRTKKANLYWIFTKGGIERHIYSAVSKKKNFTTSYYKNSLKSGN